MNDWCGDGKKDAELLVEQIKVDQFKAIYSLLSPHFSERDKRLFAAAQAMILGYRGITLVSEAVGISRTTVTAGVEELRSGEPHDSGRIRKEGGGRKKITAAQPGIREALSKLLADSTAADPERPLLWTIKSQRTLSEELAAEGFKACPTTVGKLLEEMDYSLQGNQKVLVGNKHIDSGKQFEFINKKVKVFQKHGLPVVSVDAKKKELVGNYANPGKTYRKKGSPVKVNAYDFPLQSEGKATPYGIYDIKNNRGWVNLGTDHDTAEFAVTSLRNWYIKEGRKAFSGKDKMLVTADGGGSNGSRSRLWKSELQKMADEFKLEIHVSHFPPGMSKWNKIEGRLFANISRNWQGKPLVSYEVIVELIKGTKTKKGLEVNCELDPQKVRKGN